RIMVTKFKGTPRERNDLFEVDLNNPQPVEVKLDGGSRTELAVVTEEVDRFRAETTAAPLSINPTGVGGGCGPAGGLMTSPVTDAGGPQLPVVVQPREQVLPGMGGTADIRAQYKLNPDRRTYSLTVNPVFATM